MNEYSMPSVKGNGDAGPDDAGMLEWKGTKLWFLALEIRNLSQIVSNDLFLTKCMFFNIFAFFFRHVFVFSTAPSLSGQIIATSHDLTPKGSWGREIGPFISGALSVGEIF